LIQACPIFKRNDGTFTLLVLTDTDLAQVRTGTGETYSYLTDTFTDGLISDITGATVTGTGTGWDASGLNPGDKFVLEQDLTAKGEPDDSWAEILTVDGPTQITLTASYGGTTGAFSPAVRYRARKIYSCPDNERWSWCVLNGKFIFTNGNVYAQYWEGQEPEGLTYPDSTKFAKDLKASEFYQARYVTPYANRAIFADMYDSDVSARNPWLLRTSAEGDPTKGPAEDETAVDYSFLDTQEPITGMATVGEQLIVFKKTCYYIGNRTGTSTDPLGFKGPYQGIGLYAPYSIVPFMGTCVWLGLEDFYTMNGTMPAAIGAPIRKKLFSIADEGDIKNAFGFPSMAKSEILWVISTTEGQIVIVWNFKENYPIGEWFVYEFPNTITAIGGIGFGV
jgi:hypothetical protein